MTRDTKTVMQAFHRTLADLARFGVLKLEEVEQAVKFEFVKDTLELCGFNQCHAARALGIHRNTLGRILNQMRRAGMDPGRRPTKSERARMPAGGEGKRLA